MYSTWISRRGTTWIQTKSAGMFIPTNANHLMLTTYVRNFESMACKDWNQAIPNYAHVMATHRITKQQKRFRVEIELLEISGIPQKYLCPKGRSLHDLDLSRQHHWAPILLQRIPKKHHAIFASPRKRRGFAPAASYPLIFVTQVYKLLKIDMLR